MRFKASTLAYAMFGPLTLNEGVRALLSHSDKLPFGWALTGCGAFVTLVLFKDIYAAFKAQTSLTTN